jgi:hypothetical protein
VDGLYDTALLHEAVFAAIADDGSMVSCVAGNRMKQNGAGEQSIFGG